MRKNLKEMWEAKGKVMEKAEDNDSLQIELFSWTPRLTNSSTSLPEASQRSNPDSPKQMAHLFKVSPSFSVISQVSETMLQWDNLLQRSALQFFPIVSILHQP